jgi:hypothetical protein
MRARGAALLLAALCAAAAAATARATSAAPHGTFYSATGAPVAPGSASASKAQASSSSSTTPAAVPPVIPVPAGAAPAAAASSSRTAAYSGPPAGAAAAAIPSGPGPQASAFAASGPMAGGSGGGGVPQFPMGPMGPVMMVPPMLMPPGAMLPGFPMQPGAGVATASASAAAGGAPGGGPAAALAGGECRTVTDTQSSSCANGACCSVKQRVTACPRHTTALAEVNGVQGACCVVLVREDASGKKAVSRGGALLLAGGWREGRGRAFRLLVRIEKAGRAVAPGGTGKRRRAPQPPAGPFPQARAGGCAGRRAAARRSPDGPTPRPRPASHRATAPPPTPPPQRSVFCATPTALPGAQQFPGGAVVTLNPTCANNNGRAAPALACSVVFPFMPPGFFLPPKGPATFQAGHAPWGGGVAPCASQAFSSLYQSASFDAATKTVTFDVTCQ